MKWPTLLLFYSLLWLAVSCKQKTTDTKENTSSIQPPVQVDTAAGKTAELAVNTYAGVDVSPMDMSYFPVDYPKLKMTSSKTDPPIVRVIYSRPHLQKRRLFNNILKMDEPWRLGANEATEIDFYKPVTIQGKKVNPGRYTIYSIPHPGNWSIVLNSNIDTWGLTPDTSKDVHQFDIPVSVGNPSLEYFTMVFEKTDTGADLIIAWDDILTRLPINF
jgi:hypothetical protein